MIHYSIKFLRYAGINLLAVLIAGMATTFGAARDVTAAQPGAPEGSDDCEALGAQLQLQAWFEAPAELMDLRLKIAVVRVGLQPIGQPGDEVVVERNIIIASHNRDSLAALRSKFATVLDEQTGGVVVVSSCEPAWGISERGLPLMFAGLLIATGEGAYDLLPPIYRELDRTVEVPRVPRRRPGTELAGLDVLTIEGVLDPSTIADAREMDAGVVPPIHDLEVANIPPPPDRAQDLRPDAEPVVPASKNMIDLAEVDREHLAGLDVEATPNLPLYKGIAALNLSIVTPGMSVLAIEKMDCSDKGNFFIGSYGTLVAPPTDATAKQSLANGLDEGPMLVTRSSRLAGNNYFGTVENPESIAELIGSTATDGFWCLPKQEFCYEQIGFRDFGAKGRAGDTIETKRGWVFSAENSLVMAFAAAVSDLCAVHPVGVGK